MIFDPCLFALIMRPGRCTCELDIVKDRITKIEDDESLVSIITLIGTLNDIVLIILGLPLDHVIDPEIGDRIEEGWMLHHYAFISI